METASPSVWEVEGGGGGEAGPLRFHTAMLHLRVLEANLQRVRDALLKRLHALDGDFTAAAGAEHPLLLHHQSTGRMHRDADFGVIDARVADTVLFAGFACRPNHGMECADGTVCDQDAPAAANLPTGPVSTTPPGPWDCIPCATFIPRPTLLQVFGPPTRGLDPWRTVLLCPRPGLRVPRYDCIACVLARPGHYAALALVWQSSASDYEP